MKPVLMVSFSGGRTSAYMAYWLKQNKPEFNLIFVFMNTGAEHPETLNFVNECDNRWGLNIVWLEADVNPKKSKGTGYKIVNFETASRSKMLPRNMESLTLAFHTVTAR